MDKLHILILPSWYKRFNYEQSATFVYEQAQALKEVGYKVAIVSINQMNFKTFICFKKQKGKLYEEYYDKGLLTLRLNVYKLPLPSYIEYTFLLFIIFKKYIRKYGKPDIIHAHSFYNAGLGAVILNKLYKIPIFLTEHSSSFLLKYVSLFRLFLMKKVLYKFESNFAVSKFFQKELNSIFNNNFEYLPNILPSSFENIKLESIKKDKFIILNIANLNKNKNHKLLIKAFSILAKEINDIELRIGGKGPEYSDINNYINELNMSDKVILLGELDREEVKNELTNSDLFVLSSNFETFGVVLIEALSYGKPIISTKCGGPNEIVIENNGLLVEKENVEEMSNAIKYIYNNIDKYNNQEIKEECINNYGTKSFLKRIEPIYIKNLRDKNEE